MTKTRINLVKAFYEDIWNRRDFGVAHNIISEDFRFRGSLGVEKQGIGGFLEYVEAVHTALGNYTCLIQDMISMNARIAVRLKTRGVHQAEFFGVNATYKEIEWEAAACFRISNEKLSDLWVLGDVDAVKQQLGLIPDRHF